MSKSSQLFHHKESILAIAKSYGIDHIAICNPTFDDWSEEDDYVNCMANIKQPPDNLEENLRGEIMSSFEARVEALLDFKLIVIPRDTDEALAKDFPSDIMAEHDRMIDSAIPFEELTAESLLKQFAVKMQALAQSSTSEPDVDELHSVTEQLKLQEPKLVGAAAGNYSVFHKSRDCSSQSPIISMPPLVSPRPWGKVGD